MESEDLDKLKYVEKQTYIRLGIAALIAVVLIAFGWNVKGWVSSLLIIPGIIILLIAISAFSQAFDKFWKAKGKLKEKETGEEFKETYIVWPAWAKKYGWIPAMAFFFTAIAGAKLHENDFGGNKFVWHSLIAGLIAGFVIYSLLKLKFTNWTANKNKSGEIAFYIILVSVVAVVGANPVINKYFATDTPVCNRYSLLSKGVNARHGTKYIHINNNGRDERFNPPSAFYKSLTDKDTVIVLCVQKGFFGYEFVKEFKLPEK